MSAVQDRCAPHAAAETIVFRTDESGGCGAASLALRLQACVEHGARDIVVDLGEAEMLDSTTLTALKRFGARQRMADGRLSVVCANARLASLLDLTLLSRSFALFRTLDAALAEASARSEDESIVGRL